MVCVTCIQSCNNKEIIQIYTICTSFQIIESYVETTCNVTLAMNIYKLNEI